MAADRPAVRRRRDPFRKACSWFVNRLALDASWHLRCSSSCPVTPLAARPEIESAAPGRAQRRRHGDPQRRRAPSCRGACGSATCSSPKGSRPTPRCRRRCACRASRRRTCRSATSSSLRRSSREASCSRSSTAIAGARSSASCWSSRQAITAGQLETALAEQRRWKQTLGEVVVRLKFVTEEQMRRALCQQLHINYFDLDTIVLGPRAASPRSIRASPRSASSSRSHAWARPWSSRWTTRRGRRSSTTSRRAPGSTSRSSRRRRTSIRRALEQMYPRPWNAECRGARDRAGRPSGPDDRRRGPTS